MDFTQAIILGLLQGVTEFIPVSSSGHLTLIPFLFGWKENPSLIFDIAVHGGTLIALLIYFRQKLINIASSLIKLVRKQEMSKQDKSLQRVSAYVVIATIPATIIGFLVRDVIDTVYKAEATDVEAQRAAATLTAAALIIVGIAFVLLDKFVKRHSIPSIDKLGIPKALAIGLAQAAALFRGVSRSGATILTGRLGGMQLVDAAEFSFLMSIPILVLTTGYGFYELLSLDGMSLQQELSMAIVGAVTAAISGYLAIKYMLKYLKSNGLSQFGWYRIALGLFVILILYT